MRFPGLDTYIFVHHQADDSTGAAISQRKVKDKKDVLSKLVFHHFIVTGACGGKTLGLEATLLGSETKRYAKIYSVWRLSLEIIRSNL